jgi:hypothetical protein
MAWNTAHTTWHGKWVRMGHRVRIIAASQSHVRTHQPEMAGVRIDEVIDGIEYTWL